MRSASKLFEESSEHIEASSASRIVPMMSAMVAVLAALGSLFSHHASIQALAIKNQAIHESISASDQYGYYQAKRMRVSLFNALIDAGIARDSRANDKLKKDAEREERSSLSVIADARELEKLASAQQDHSQVLLRAFGVFELATSLFEISIVLVSISALTRATGLFWTSAALSAIGVVLLVVGFLIGH